MGLDGSQDADAPSPSWAATKDAPSAPCATETRIGCFATPPSAASSRPTEAPALSPDTATEAPETDAPPATEPLVVEAAVQAWHAAQEAAECARAAASLSTDRAMIRFKSFSGNTYTSTSTTRNASAIPTPIRTMPST